MNIRKAMVIGTAALAVFATVTGAALASNRGARTPAKPTMSVTKAADTDNIQEGDQTSPDNPNEALEVAAAPTNAAASAKTALVRGSTSMEGESSGESESESSGENEGSGESDGPGGHEDPPGQDVNHEFDGEE